MTVPLLVAKSKRADLALLPALANRHGEVVRGVLGSILGGGGKRRR